MQAKISKGNIKTGRIPAVSLPPIKSCGNCNHCKDKCYAIKSYRQYPATKNAWDHNYDFAQKDLPAYILSVRDYIVKHKPKYFRWHVSGDIIDNSYLQGIKFVADYCKDTKFLIFTKMFDLNYGRLPKNLSVIFSLFPGMKKPRRRLPRAYAIESGDPIPKNAVECQGNCETCGICWSLKELKTDVFFYMH